MAELLYKYKVIPFETFVWVGIGDFYPNDDLLVVTLRPGEFGFSTALEAVLIRHFKLSSWKNLIRWAIVASPNLNYLQVEGAIYD
jgi:hypothetical protein